MFSVIIPLYNKAPYVAKAIESVLSQTFTDYELIVVNDGSTDNSAAIAEQSLVGQANCKLIRQENAGASVARNNGVSASNGEYLCFLDADDWWDSTFLEEMEKLVGEFPGAGIYGSSYTIVNERKHKTRIAHIGVEDGFEKGYINYCQVYAKTLNMPLCTGTVCVPRAVYAEMGGFPSGINLGEDFLLWIKIALKYDVVFSNKALFFYNQDVEIKNRGVGPLHHPKHHMLWNLDTLSKEERTNPDYKRLIDNLRTYELMPYYLSSEYRKYARKELAKVDWELQPSRVRALYQMPVFLLRCRQAFLQCGSWIKQRLH